MSEMVYSLQHVILPLLLLTKRGKKRGNARTKKEETLCQSNNFQYPISLQMFYCYEGFCRNSYRRSTDSPEWLLCTSRTYYLQDQAVPVQYFVKIVHYVYEPMMLSFGCCDQNYSHTVHKIFSMQPGVMLHCCFYYVCGDNRLQVGSEFCTPDTYVISYISVL